jgi:gag-polyprotein putative aspartyl protease
VTPVPVPGEARVVRALRRLVLIQDITLGFGGREAPRDAIFDTGSMHCITKALANRLNLHPGERIGAERVQGVSGRAILLDRSLLEYVRAGTAQAWDVDVLVGGTAPGNFMLLGMSFSFIRRILGGFCAPLLALAGMCSPRVQRSALPLYLWSASWPRRSESTWCRAAPIRRPPPLATRTNRRQHVKLQRATAHLLGQHLPRYMPLF